MPIPKIIPKGTTREQWEQYELVSEMFEKQMRSIEPADKESKEWLEWSMDYSMNMPNKPGYFRANND